ncbi:hypothetical protein HYV91_01340 [Candidatus Wolfebacteria bacterium]|nr:hypothetical protein [Candidatus Wolfebacteria bacterium]
MKSELFLEEAVLDDLAQEFDSLELPISKRAFRLILVIAFLAGLVVLWRIIFLGVWLKDFYIARALFNANEITTLRAPRGVIFDRFGKAISENIPTFRLKIKLVEFLKANKDRERAFGEMEAALGIRASSRKHRRYF